MCEVRCTTRSLKWGCCECWRCTAYTGRGRVMAGPEPGRTGSNVTGQSVGMRLNQLPADSGGSTGSSGWAGGQKNLASSPTEKKAAAKTIEDHIEPDTRKAGDWADVE